MGFDQTLHEAVERVEGCVAAMLMDADGIAIETYIQDDSTLDVQTMSVEYARIVNETQSVAETLDSGDLRELTINTQQSTIIIRVVQPGYYLVMLLEGGGNTGKARYVSQIAGGRLNKEI